MKIRAKNSERMKSLRERVGKLTLQEEFALICGDDPDRPVFASEDEMREAWEVHRHEIQCNPGTRPFAWWRLEHPEYGDPTGPAAMVGLVELGELTEAEAEHMRKLGGAYWPAEVAKAWAAREVENA